MGQREDYEPQPHDPDKRPVVAVLQGPAVRAQDVPRGGGRDLLQGGKMNRADEREARGFLICLTLAFRVLLIGCYFSY